MSWKFLVYTSFICLAFSTPGLSNTPGEGNINSYSHLYFELNQGLIIIDATVNNVEGKFIFDTGLEGIILNGKVLKTDQVYETVVGSTAAEEVNIKQIKIGNLIKKDQKAYRSDLTALKELLQIQIHGMIGLSVLKDMLISIDYKSQTLKLFPKVSNIDQITKNKRRMQFIMQSDVPCITLDHYGTTLLFALDTGAGGHFIDNTNLNLQEHNSGFKTVFGINGKCKHSTSTTLSLNRFDVSLDLGFRLLDLSDINEQLDHPINGILSAKELFQNQIIIDCSKNLLYY